MRSILVTILNVDGAKNNVINMKKTIMLVSPHITGGTDRHIWEMAMSWSNQGHCVLVLRIHYEMARLYVCSNGRKSLPILFSVNEKEIFLELLEAFDLSVIHYHHFIKMDEFWLNLGKYLNVRIFVTLHDYASICPFFRLVDYTGVYCNVPSANSCNVCVRKQKNKLLFIKKCKNFDIGKWRGRWHAFLKKADVVIVPHEDVKNRISNVWNDLPIKVFNNPEIIKYEITNSFFKPNDKILKIGIIGGMDASKGANILLDVAREIKKNRYAIKLFLFGTIENNEEIETLKIFGRYRENAVYQQIIDNNIDFFWFPGLCPETYSYTLTIPIRLGIPVIATDLGAIGARVKENCWGDVYPWNSDVRCIIKKLMAFNYMKYRNMKNNFIISNTRFPLANDLYEIDGKFAEIDISSIVSLSVNLYNHDKIYMNDVLISDLKIMKMWKVSVLNLIKLIPNINVEKSIRELINKRKTIFNCLKQILFTKTK